MERISRSSVDNHVIYIPGKYFPSLPNLTNHIRTIHKTSCGSDISLCRSEKCSNTVLAIYLLEPMSVINQNTLESNYKNVISFLTLEIISQEGEIYNVCTDKFFRRRGIATKLLKSVLVDIGEKSSIPIWLGVFLSNPLLVPVLNLYLSVGFGPEGIQSIAPLTGSYPGEPFISLIYPSHGSVIERKEKAMRMIREYKNNKGRCSLDIVIDPLLISEIYDEFITQSVEYGGVMGLKKIGKNKYLAGLAAVTRGSEQTFTVSYPFYYITWHTHPFICYRENLCYIGWPSGMDMGSIVKAYRYGQVAHILFANEGIYILQLSDPMMTMVRSMDDECIDMVSQLINYYFDDLEHFREVRYDGDRLECIRQAQDVRCLTYDSRQKHLSIRNIMTIINTFTLTGLLTAKPNTPYLQNLLNSVRECLVKAGKRIGGTSDIPIFKGFYDDKDTALKKGIRGRLNYIIAPFDSFCPLPEYEGEDINYGIEEMEISR
jgi:hypothetical protein